MDGRLVGINIIFIIFYAEWPIIPTTRLLIQPILSGLTFSAPAFHPLEGGINTKITGILEEIWVSYGGPTVYSYQLFSLKSLPYCAQLGSYQHAGRP